VTAAHERPEFQNSVSWTVVITFVVAGGARPQTARARAEKLAARIVSAAARLAGVVEVRAVGGETSAAEGFKPVCPRSVAFDAANIGRDRYLDPDRERALASLAEENAAYRARRQADEDRRRAVGCANTYQFVLSGRRSCECVYCAPATFLAGLTTPYPDDSTHPINRPRCVCGAEPWLLSARAASEQRCSRHHFVRIVVLDGDAPAIAEAAGLDPLTADQSVGEGSG
jgi:hypothetical protein